MPETVNGPAAAGADVVIVGGGAIGLAIAWKAAQAGLAAVVVDPSPGGGASYVAAGMLAPVTEAQFGEPDLLALNQESCRRYPEFAAALGDETGLDIKYVECGSLLVARDADDAAALQRELQFRQRLGLQVERLTATEARRLEPALAPSIRGAVRAAGDHQVNPRLLTRALLEACVHRGVRVVRSQAELMVDSGGVSGVRTDDGVVATRVTVLAAGAWSACLPGVPDDARPPVRPVKGQVLRLSSSDGAPVVRHVVRGIDGYLVARPGGEVVCGATAEERGFDTTVTADALYELLRMSRELVPQTAEMHVIEASAGLRPATPDNAPCIGWTVTPGLLTATGHYRNGILLTPVTADAVVALLLEREPPVDIRPFSPLRFARVEQEIA